MLIERKFYYDRKEVMKYMEYWSNDACEGYAIMAMEDAGLDNETIRKVLRIMSYDLFDSVSVDEAKEYCLKKRF